MKEIDIEDVRLQRENNQHMSSMITALVEKWNQLEGQERA